MSDKIQSQHLARKAVLYVRQSSAFQVLHNQESQKLLTKFFLRHQVVILSWAALFSFRDRHMTEESRGLER